jgi:hypothetical protein
MGRNTRPPRINTARVMIRDVAVLESAPLDSRCWQFAVIGATGAQQKTGTAVEGLIIGNRVVVSLHGQALGFAPNKIAAEMIAAARTSGRRLRGRVLSAQNASLAPLIELCLR